MKAGLIPHMPNEPLVMIRQCYLKICDNDACEAALLNHLEYCLMWKRRTQGQAERLNQAALASGELPAQDTEDWWYATIDELGENLLNCWGRSKVIAALNSLILRGYVERRRNPKYKMDRTWQYRLCIQHVKDGLKKAGYEIADSDDASVENNQSEDQPMDTPPETVNASVESNRSSVGNNRSSVGNNRSSVESRRTIPEIPFRDSQSEIPTENDSLAPDGAVVGGVSSPFENDLALPEETCWSREGIANLLTAFLAPLPAMRQAQRAQAEQQWQQAIESIFQNAALRTEAEDDRAHLFSDLLRFVTSAEPCKYRRWWMEHIGDINKLRAWHVADNLFRIYQDLMKSGWRPENEPASAEPVTEALSQPPEPDREPEPVVTPEPEMEIGAPIGMDGATAREMARFIRKERSGYCVEIKPCAGGGYSIEAAAHIEKIYRIVTQDDLDDFLERTKRRSWREVAAELEARRLPKAS